jgi:hypothetical protein
MITNFKNFLYEYSDYVKLPDGKTLDCHDNDSYPFMYLYGEDFFVGQEATMHIQSLEDYYEKQKDRDYLEAKYPEGDTENIDYQGIDDYLHDILDTCEFKGRIWTNKNVLAFWDLNCDESDIPILKKIIKELEDYFDIQIDPETWWIEFFDVGRQKQYFVTLEEFYNNDIDEGEKESEDEGSMELRKKYHQMSPLNKPKIFHKGWGSDSKRYRDNQQWKYAAPIMDSKQINETVVSSDYKIQSNYYWDQIKDKKDWKPITDELFDSIEEEGWVNDLTENMTDKEYDDNREIIKSGFKYKILDLYYKWQKEEIKLEYSYTINTFKKFDKELKDSQEFPYYTVMFIDYDEGIIYIIKYKKPIAL